MSIENDLNRIANALEALTARAGTVCTEPAAGETAEASSPPGHVKDTEDAATEAAITINGPEEAKAKAKAARKKASRKRADKKAAETKAKAKETGDSEDEEDEDEVPMVDTVRAHLSEFVIEHGKPRAKEILLSMDAGSATTMDPSDYVEFLERLTHNSTK